MAFLGSIGAMNNFLKVGKPDQYISWWLFDLDNIQLISLTTVPDNVADSKGISHVEITVPGLGYKPLLFSSLENKKIAFTIRAIARNQVFGNQIYIKQFDSLRRPKVGLDNLLSFDTMAFAANPKVLYHYGTGSTVPLVYFVTKCDMSHSKYNNWGYPQVTDIAMELTLDEEHIINYGEEIARRIAMIAGTVQSLGTLTSRLAGKDKKKPY